MRRVPQQYPNPQVRREGDPRATRRQALLLAGCVALAAGFVFAVRQQILAVEYGYKTEALRREREQLLDEQRKLLLALEESSSPAHVEAAARELDMQPASASNIDAGAAGREARAGGARPVVGAATAATVLRR
jgi:cell division protein FtsL